MNNVAGFFLHIGGREIAYGDIALLAASVAAICYLLPHGKIDRKQILVSLLLVGAACLGALHTKLWRQVKDQGLLEERETGE